MKSKFLEKKFPTLIGLTILVAALIAGVVFNASGPGIFSPRATPQTTPKNIKATNISDTSFTVSFLTDEVTSGFVKYGTSPTTMTTQASDDRDQLAGNIGTYTTHHITIRGLQPQTTYFYTIGTGSIPKTDNNGQPFSTKTASKAGGSSLAQTIYGTVLDSGSNPAEGSIVFVKITDTGELSTLVRSSGTWAIPLSQARTEDGSKVPTISSSTAMNVNVQGSSASQTSSITTTVGQPQLPVETITLGGTTNNTPTANSGTNVTPAFSASDSATITQSPSATPIATVTQKASPAPVITASASATITSTIIPTATATEEVTHPSTESGELVSGSLENTILLLIIGLGFISLGTFAFSRNTIKQ